MAMVAKKVEKKVWDQMGSYSYWKEFQTMGIESVGRVTVWHMPFSDLKMQVALYRHAVTEGHEDEVKLRAQHLNTYIKVFKRYVAVGGGSKPLFESPLTEVPAENAPVSLPVAPMLIEAAVERAKEMLVKEVKAVPHQLLAAEEVTLRNLDRFSEVMIRAGRMAQEKTIDAAKTADAPHIFLEKMMKVMKMNLRRGAFEVKFDFDEKKDFAVRMADEESRCVPTENGEVFHLADFFDELRRKAAIEGIQGWKDAILAVKPEIPQEFLVHAQEIIDTRKGLPAILSVLMKANRTLENIRKARVKEYAGGDQAFQKAAEDTVRDEFRTAFDAITATARQALKGLTPEEAVLVVLALTAETMGKDARRPASFVSTALEEEFLLFIISLCDEEPIAREKLVNADHLKDGAEVEFIDGREANGRAFTDAVLPDGVYTILKEGRRVYATRKVADVIRGKLAEETPKQIVFQSTRFAKKEDAEAFDRKVRGAKLVTLITSDKQKTLNSDCDIRDAVIADGVIVGHFDNKVAPQVYLMSHKTLPANTSPAAKAIVSPAVNDFYNFRQGQWLCSEVNEIRENGVIVGFNVFVALENVEKTFAPNVRKLYPRITLAPAAKKVDRPVGRFDSIMTAANKKQVKVGKSHRNPFAGIPTPADAPVPAPSDEQAPPAPADKDASVFGQFAGVATDDF